MTTIILPIIGITFMLMGFLAIIAIILKFTINKNTRLYKYLTKPVRKGWFDKFLEKHLSEKANMILEIVLGIIVCLAIMILGLNTLLKGILDPYGLGFWVLF